MAVLPKINPNQDQLSPNVKATVFDLNNYKNYLGSEAYGKIGINPNVSPSEQEFNMDKAQPLSEAVTSALVKTWDNTTNAASSYVKSYYTSADQLMKEQEDLLKNQEMEQMKNPTFQSNPTHGMLQTMFSGDFWEQSLPSIGFMAGTAGPAAIENLLVDATGGLFDGLGEAAAARGIYKTGKAIDFLMNVDKIKKAKNLITGAAEGVTTAEKISTYGKAAIQLYNTINAAKSEATMEGGQTLFATKQQLIDEYKAQNDGIAPIGEDLERIEKTANKAATTDFYLNMPILLASNLIQMHDIFIPEVAKLARTEKALFDGYKITSAGLGQEAKLVKNTFSDIWKSTSGLNRVKEVASYIAKTPIINGIKDPISEGMEESLQRLASTFSQDYYTKQYHNREDFTDSLSSSISDMLSDQGKQEFLGGFVIGALGHTRHNVKNLYDKVKGNKSESQKREEDLQDRISLLNDNPLSMLFKADGVKDALTNSELGKQMHKAIESGDMFNLKNKQNLGILNYIWAGYKSGALNYRMSELKKLTELNPNNEELAQMLGVNPNDINSENVKDIFGSLHNKTLELMPMIKSTEAYYAKHSKIEDARKQAMEDQVAFDKHQQYLITKYKESDLDKLEKLVTQDESKKFIELAEKRNLSSSSVFAYEDALKGSVFAMASVQLDKKRQEKLHKELNDNNLQLNYSELPSLTSPKLVRSLISSKKQELKAAQDAKAKVGNLQSQIDVLEELHTAKKHNDIADLIQQYIELNSKNNNPNFKDIPSSIEAEHFKKVTDFVKLEQKNKQNINVHNFLLNINNFEKLKEETDSKLEGFLNNINKWRQDLQKEESVSDTTTETPQEQTNDIQGTEQHLEEVIKAYQGNKYEDISFKKVNGVYSISGKDKMTGEYKEIKDVPEFMDALDNINKEYADEQEKIAKEKEADENNSTWLKDVFEQKIKELTDKGVTEKAKKELISLLSEREQTSSIVNKIKEINNLSIPTNVIIESDNFEPLFTPEESGELDQMSWAKPSTWLKTTTQEEAIDEKGNFTGEVKNNSFTERIVNFKSNTQAISDLTNGTTKLFVMNGSMELAQEEGNYTEDNALAPIIMVTDEEGIPILFDQQGNQNPTSGKPVWFTLYNKKELDIEAASTQLMKTEGISKEQALEKLKEEKQQLSELKKEFYDEKGNPVQTSKKIEVNFESISKGFTIDKAQTTTTSEIGLSKTEDFIVIQSPKTPNQSTIPMRTTYENQVVANGMTYIKRDNQLIPIYGIPVTQAKINGQSLVEHIDELIDTYNEHHTSDDVLRNNLLSYLNAIIYTSNKTIKIKIDEFNKIYLTYPIAGLEQIHDKKKQMTSFVSTHSTKQKINISKKALNSAIPIASVEDGKIETQPGNKEFFKKFVTDNSYTPGVYTPGKGVQRINKYITFKITPQDFIKNEDLAKKLGITITPQGEAVDIDATPNNVVTNNSVSSDDIEAKKIERRRQAEIQGELESNPKVNNDNSTITKETLFENKHSLGEDENFDEPLESKRNSDDIPNMGEISEEVKEYLTDLVGENGWKLKQISNSGAWATFTTSMITLYAGARNSDAYHEAWHHFSQMFLTQKQKRNLYNEIRNQKGIFLDEDGKTKVEFSKATDYQIEEFIARDFAKFMDSNGELIMDKTPERRNIFQKIWYLLKQIFTNKVDLQTLYSDLRDVKSLENKFYYKPSFNNAIWGRLNSKVVNDSNLEVLPNERIDYHNQLISSVIGLQCSKDIGILSKKEAKGVTFAQNNGLKALFETKNGLVYTYNAAKVWYKEQLESGKLTKQLTDEFNTLLIPENWRAFILQHQQINKIGISTKVDISDSNFIFEEDEDTGGKDAMYSDKIFEEFSNEKDSWDAADPEVKQLFRLAIKYKLEDDVAVPDLDKYGFPQKAEETDFYNNVVKLTNGNVEVDAVFDILKNNIQSYPEIQQLLDLLPAKYDKLGKPIPLSVTKTILLNKFVQTLEKPFVQCVALNLSSPEFNQDGTLKTPGVAKAINLTTLNKEDIVNQILSDFNSMKGKNNQWVKNDIIASHDGSNFITQEFLTSSFYKDKNRFVGGKGLDNKLKFLTLLGVTGITTKNINKNDFNANVSTEVINMLFNRLASILSDPYFTPNSTKNILIELRKTESTSVDSLLQYLSRHSKSHTSMTFKTEEGKNQSAIQSHNGYTVILSKLSKVKNLKELAEIPFMNYIANQNNSRIRGSYWMKLMFDENGDRVISKKGNTPVTLQILNINSFGIQRGNKWEKASTYKLNERNKFLLDYHNFLIHGRVDIQRTESASSFYSIAPTTYDSSVHTIKNLPISKEDVSSTKDIFISSKFLDIVLPYVEAELFGIKQDSISKPKNRKALTSFSIFDEVFNGQNNSLEFGKKLIAELAIKDSQEVVNDNKDAIAAHLSSYFQKEVTYFLQKQKELGITPDEFTSEIFPQEKLKNTQALIKSLRSKRDADSESMANIEQMKLDKSIERQFLQNAQTFIANYFIQAVEFNKIFESDLNDYGYNYFKRSKGMNSTKKPMFNDEHFRQFLASTPYTINSVSNNIPYVADDFKTIKTTTFQDVIKDSVYMDNTVTKNGVTMPKLVHDFIISEAIKTNSTENFSQENINRISDEILHNYSTKKGEGVNEADGQGHCTLDFYRWLMLGVGNWSTEREALYTAEVLLHGINKQHFSEEEKPAIYEKIKKAIKDSKGVTFPIIKANYRHGNIYDKFSLAPLIPSAIIGKQWDAIHDKMIASKTMYSKFASGSKLFKPEMLDFFKFEEIKDENTLQHFPEFMGEQIQASEKTKNEATWSTQQRVLIFAGLLENGKPISPEVEQWVNRYDDIMNRFKTYNRGKVAADIGLSNIDGKWKIEDKAALAQKLHKLILERELNSNIQDYIQYEKQLKDFKYELDLCPAREQIQGMLSSIIDNQIRKVKLNGSMLVQQANTGHEFTNASKEDILKYGTNGLNFYHLEQVSKNGKNYWVNIKMGVKVSWKAYKNLANLPEVQADPNPDKRIVVNKLLQNKEFTDKYEKELSLIGCRIPVQGINSQDTMLIKEFLPESAGDIIILPAEVTRKSGTDYDIDKMTIIRPFLNKNGTLVKPNTSQVNKEDIKKQIKEIENSLLPEVKEYNKENWDAIQLLKSYIKEDKELLETETDLDKIEELENNIDKNKELVNSYYDGLSENNIKIKNHYNKLKDLNNSLNQIENGENQNKLLTNELMDLYSDILTHPIQFSQLVTPNTDSYVKQVTEELNKLRPKKEESNDTRGVAKYKNTSVLTYRASLDKFESIQTLKGLLGVMAKNNKTIVLLQAAGLKLKTSYKYKSEENGKPVIKERKIRMLLLSREEEQKKIKEGGFSLADEKDIHGFIKQELGSQLVNVTVDAASDPFFSNFGVNWSNVGTFWLLIHAGIPLKRIGVFINQPVLLEYYSRINKGADRSTALQFLYDELRTKIERINPNEKIGNFASVETTNFDIPELVKKAYKPVYTTLNSYEDLYEQIKVLGHFIHLTKIATAGDAGKVQNNTSNSLKTLISATSYDTSKQFNHIDARANKETVETFFNDFSYFEQKSLDKLVNKSWISGFNYNDMLINSFEEVFKYTTKESISDLIQRMSESKNTKWNKKEQSKRVLQNDYIEAIVKTYGEIKGENLQDYGVRLLEGENRLANQLVDMKEKLSSFPIMSRFYIDTKNRKANVAFRRLIDNTVDDQNNYIKQLKDMLQHPDKDVQLWAQQLFILSFIQSGFNKSHISFNDVVPFEFQQLFIIPAIKKFDRLSEEEKTVFLKKFQIQALKQNKNGIFYDDKEFPTGNQPFRFKDYNLNNVQLPNINDIIIEPSQETEEENTSIDTEGFNSFNEPSANPQSETGILSTEVKNSNINNQIKSPKKSSKKEKYNIILSGSKEKVSREGYKIIISEYPSTKFYIYKNEFSKKWEVEDVTTGFAFPIKYSTTLDEILKEFQETVNKYALEDQGLSVLKTTGLFNTSNQSTEVVNNNSKNSSNIAGNTIPKQSIEDGYSGNNRNKSQELSQKEQITITQSLDRYLSNGKWSDTKTINFTKYNNYSSVSTNQLFLDTKNLFETRDSMGKLELESDFKRLSSILITRRILENSDFISRTFKYGKHGQNSSWNIEFSDTFRNGYAININTGNLLINPSEFVKDANHGNSFEDFLKYTDIRLSEEAIHKLVIQNTTKEELAKIQKELAENNLLGDLRTIYFGNNADAFESFMNIQTELGVHEFIRMIIQNKINGTTTEIIRNNVFKELYNKVKQLIIDALNNVFSTYEKMPVNTASKTVINRIMGIVSDNNLASEQDKFDDSHFTC